MVESDYALCGSCWRDLPLISGAVCDGCGVPIPAGDGRTDVQCDDCLRLERPWVQGRCALLYQDLGRSLVLSLKHGDRQEVARMAAPWMARALRDMGAEGALLVPVPLHWTRMLHRRFNQSASLTLALAAETKSPVCLDLLGRSQRTQSLDGLTQLERFEMLSGAIAIADRNKARVADAHVVIVDDVMTTGATLAACAEACVSAGARKVDVLALARVTKDA